MLQIMLYQILPPSLHVRYLLSHVRLSVVSVMLVHPTQAVEIFGNFYTAFGTLATR